MQRWRSIPNGNTKNYPPLSTFRRHRKTWSFHVDVLQRTAKKCTKNYNACAQLLFCSLSLLFSDVLVAVVVVVCLSSLISGLTRPHVIGFVADLFFFHSGERTYFFPDSLSNSPDACGR